MDMWTQETTSQFIKQKKVVVKKQAIPHEETSFFYNLPKVISFSTM